MSANLCVKSSSIVLDAINSALTDGLTATGGTGNILIDHYLLVLILSDQFPLSYNLDHLYLLIFHITKSGVNICLFFFFPSYPYYLPLSVNLLNSFQNIMLLHQ